MGSSSLILQNFKTLVVGGREQERDGNELAERQSPLGSSNLIMIVSVLIDPWLINRFDCSTDDDPDMIDGDRSYQ